MNRINELIELCGKSYIKKFGIAFFIMLICTTIQVYSWCAYSGTEVVESSVIIRFTLPLGSIYLFALIIIWMHHRRVKKIFQEGAYQRIRLLPIPKMSIVYSELIYVGATFVMMMLSISIGFLLGYLLCGGFHVNELFYLLANHEELAIFWPMTGIDVLKSIMLIVSLTYGTVLFLLSKADGDYSTTTKVLLVIFMIAAYIINVLAAASSQGFNGNPGMNYVQLTGIKLMEMAFITLFAHVRLYKYYGRREKKS